MTEQAEIHEHRWPTDEGPWLLTYRLGYVEGRAECIGLTIESADPDRPQPVRSTELRALAHGFRAVGSELAQALDEFGARTRADSDPNGPNLDLASFPTTLRSARYPPEHYQRLLTVYLSNKSAPTRAVQEEFGVPYSTARSWVAAARRLGLLSESGRGRVSGLADDQGADSDDEEKD
jgi:hypothetical protein